MAPSKKIDLKDKVEEGEIDLSMLSLEEVPVREISSVKKVHSLDLSNNHLERLPANFATLTFLTKINLSKNNLKELPENFGNLEKLIHLDLYKNQLQHLPLSFFQLKNLKWLDLKDNPLVPAIAKVAGPCLDNKQCQQCAKNIIQFYIDMNERIKQIKEEQEVQRQKNLAYKAKLERKKKEKKQRQKDKNDNVPKHISTKEVKETVFEPITKVEPVNKVKHRKSFFLTFVHVFVIFSLFLYCGLFVVTSLKIKGSENIVEFITSLWTNVKGLCPSYLDDYINIFEKNFIIFHTFVGNNLIRIHKNILSSPQLLIIRDYFYYMFQSVSKKISDTYHSIF